MNWSWDIGRIFGIRIRIHYVFVLLLLFVFVTNTRSEGLADGLTSLLFMVGVFAIVVLHELGHSLVAKHEGVRVVDITLLPIGGVARLENMPENPSTEIKVAVAGPLVNLALAVLLLPVVAALLAAALVFRFSFIGLGFLAGLYVVNAVMGLFNLIPAFPLDGGRILRALLAKRGDYAWATSVAARTGRIIAVVMAIVGLWLNPWLILLAAFIYFAGSQEERMVHARESMREQMKAAGPFVRYEFYIGRLPHNRLNPSNFPRPDRDIPFSDP